jgi:prepilin-type processing-associated H-X9-DG protein
MKRYHARSNYRGICGAIVPLTFIPNADYGGVLFQNSRVRFTDVTDGTSSTVALGECYADPGTNKVGALWVGMEDSIGTVYISDVFWGLDTGNYRINGPGAQAFGSRHIGGGAQFAFCDGHVQFIHPSADPNAVMALAGRADGIVVNGDF